MFLTHEEIARITGKRQKAAQIRVLLKKGYPYDTDDQGWPLVLASTVRARHEQGGQPERRGPDRAALAALLRRG